VSRFPERLLLPFRHRWLLLGLAGLGLIVALGLSDRVGRGRSEGGILADALEVLRRELELVVIPPHGGTSSQLARFVPASAPAPLLVDLPSWGGTPRGRAGSPESLVNAARRMGWNYIRPALAGPNRSPAACCADGVIDAVNAAIAYAQRHGTVLPGAVFVVGESGGGYTGLCALMSGRVAAAAFFVWVPISDLEAWYLQLAGQRYRSDILQCTVSADNLNVAEARRRSPLHMQWNRPTQPPTVRLYAGVHDGALGTVPPTHSLRMFNHLADLLGTGTRVSEAEILQLLERRTGNQSSLGRSMAGRPVHLFREAGPVSLVIFEGGHELLTEQVVSEICAWLRSRPFSRN
jgi:hypothetical protein